MGLATILWFLDFLLMEFLVSDLQQTGLLAHSQPCLETTAAAVISWRTGGACKGMFGWQVIWAASAQSWFCSLANFSLGYFCFWQWNKCLGNTCCYSIVEIKQVWTWLGPVGALSRIPWLQFQCIFQWVNPLEQHRAYFWAGLLQLAL